MVQSPSLSFYVWLSASIVQILGLLLTAWRVYFRLTIRRFWWEDAWAAVLLLTGLISVIAYWIYLLGNNSMSIIAAWIYAVCYSCIAALARMSVLFSIIRIIHGGPWLLRFTSACVAFSAACLIVITVQKVWYCASDLSWQHTKLGPSRPFCAAQQEVFIFQFVTNSVSVSILVVLPLRMLWKVKLPRRQRRMILSIFASSIVLAFGELLHAVGQILGNRDVGVVGMDVEISLSIVICNLLVVVTYTYRFLLHSAASEETTEDTSDDFTTPAVPATTLSLTTVDLEVSSLSLGNAARSQESSTKSKSTGEPEHKAWRVTCA